ncbi:MAG: SGNH/GDSL hydrolase family protein [Clostridia bacterium]|nr:SGNH/GDSL hydrolase family protein [Clostridia bacterium]
MNIEKYFDPDEQPLDNIPEDGGFTAIFRTVACIGDSLSSGEFETLTPDGKKHYNDFFEYSWGQFMARTCGFKCYNFSKGGMTAKQYMETFAESKDFFNPEYASQAYIIALGVNDLNHKWPLGTIDDVNDDDPGKNPDTFAGWYGRIVAKYKEIAPDAKFFFMTMPRSGNESSDVNKAAHAKLLHDFADHYTNSYVIDFFRYAPVYDNAFKEKFYLLGHLNPCGYRLTGKMVAAYIDWIIRHNIGDFKRIGYNGTALSDSELKKLQNN